MLKCWLYVPHTRPSFKTLVQHLNIFARRSTDPLDVFSGQRRTASNGMYSVHCKVLLVDYRRFLFFSRPLILGQLFPPYGMKLYSQTFTSGNYSIFHATFVQVLKFSRGKVENVEDINYHF